MHFSREFGWSLLIPDGLSLRPVKNRGKVLLRA